MPDPNAERSPLAPGARRRLAAGLLAAAGILAPGCGGEPTDRGGEAGGPAAAGSTGAAGSGTQSSASARPPAATPEAGTGPGGEARGRGAAPGDAVDAAGPDGPAAAEGVDLLPTVLDSLPPIETISPGDTPPLPAEMVPFFRLIESGRSDVARVRLRRHLAVEPEDGLARFLFGLTYHRERRYREAAPWMAEAIARRPDYGPALYFAGWGRFYLGELDLAERLWRRHAAMQPEYADTHFGLGLVDLELGRPEAAAERFRRAIELEADRPGRERNVAKSWARLGDALADMGRPAEGREAIEQAVALWPDHHEAWARLARLARRLGDEEAAVRAEAEAEEARARTAAAGDRRP